MPSVVQVAQNLEYRYISGAPKANKEKIKRVIQVYREHNNVTRNIAEKVVVSLYLPSAFGHVGKRGKPRKADEMLYADTKTPAQTPRDLEHAEGESRGSTK